MSCASILVPGHWTNTRRRRIWQLKFWQAWFVANKCTGRMHTPFQGDLKLHVEEKGDTGTDAADIFWGWWHNMNWWQWVGTWLELNKEIDVNSISPVWPLPFRIRGTAEHIANKKIINTILYRIKPSNTKYLPPGQLEAWSFALVVLQFKSESCLQFGCQCLWFYSFTVTLCIPPLSKKRGPPKRSGIPIPRAFQTSMHFVEIGGPFPPMRRPL